MSSSAPVPSPDASRVVETVVDKLSEELIELRRDLHAHPELSWVEHRTTGLVAAQVAEAGWTVTRHGDSGLVADLGTDGPLVALRADLDALPVDDTSGDPWASTVPGPSRPTRSRYIAVGWCSMNHR